MMPMKQLMKSAFAIIIAVMAAACSEDAVPVAAETIDVVLDGVIAGYSADDTKAAAQNVVRVMWKGGEEVQVYGGKTYLGCLTASVTGTDSTYAKLSGTILAPDEGKPVTLLYDNVAEPVLFPDGRISLDFSVQEEEDAHFAMYASLPSLEGTRNGNNASVSNLKVPFKLATAIFKCNCTCLPQAEECEAVISDVNTECVITLSDTAGPAVNGSGRGTITVKCGAVSPYKGVTFSVGLPPAPAAASRSIVMTAVDEHYDASFPKNAFESQRLTIHSFCSRSVIRSLMLFCVAVSSQESLPWLTAGRSASLAATCGMTAAVSASSLTSISHRLLRLATGMRAISRTLRGAPMLRRLLH